ncbi:acetylornithine deacetylase [Palleronia marisminoris]|uniref:Acetylornithine deacetylase n=1 Tax=Palleronia marisminoris TaxID=315423 RepID=A0A1Y5RN81_9RHOB|nr:acetylornithine deacetylase [Palleronia marisminoris]SFG28264.1 acetylornithine deacetylase [Palleronia marisminoris]SLN21051.1 Acetylornithine deacetylase [Palleronia marisminoris]
MTSLDLLSRLIAFPTVSADSNLPLIEWVEDYLLGCGFVVHRLPDPSGRKAGLFARIGPPGPGGVMLSAHTDVVPVTGQAWTRDPFRLTVDGGRLYGRGTTDMKGFLAAMLRLARLSADRPLAEPLKFAISYDEEVGCRGIAQMISRLESSVGLPRLCIVGEPTSMQIAIGHKGKAAYRATCRGEAGHSSLAPLFRNAIHLGTEFVAAVRDIQAQLAGEGATDEAYAVSYSTIHSGMISGGTALNIVPDLCTVDLEIRHLAADPLGPLEDRLHAAAAQIGSVEVEKITAYPGLEVSQDDPAINELLTLLPEPRLTKVAYGTEAGHFHCLGIPTLVCGPGNMDQGHKTDEFIERAQLVRCDRMMDRLLERLAL